MSQVVFLDATTLLVKSDNESDLADIVDYISQKDRTARIHSLLESASKIRIKCKDYKFNRDECYER